VPSHRPAVRGPTTAAAAAGADELETVRAHRFPAGACSVAVEFGVLLQRVATYSVDGGAVMTVDDHGKARLAGVTLFAVLEPTPATTR